MPSRIMSVKLKIEQTRETAAVVGLHLSYSYLQCPVTVVGVSLSL